MTRLAVICNAVIEAGLLAAAMMIPLFFNPQSSRQFEPDKVFILRTLAVLVAVAWAIGAVERRGGRTGATPTLSLVPTDVRPAWRRILAQLGPRGPYGPLVLCAALYFGCLLLSTVFSLSPHLSWWGSRLRLQGAFTALSYGVLFAALVFRSGGWPTFERMVSAMILASVAVSVYGIMQRFHLDFLAWRDDVAIRVTSTFGNPIFVASYLVMVVPLTGARLLNLFLDDCAGPDPDRGARWAAWQRPGLLLFYGGVILLQLAALVFSQSRGPLLGLLGGLLFMAWLGLPLFNRWAQADGAGSGARWLKGLGYAGLALILGAILFIGALNLPIKALDRFKHDPFISRLSQLNQHQNQTSRVRVLIWDGVWRLVLRDQPLGIPGVCLDRWHALRPWVGYGPESMINTFAVEYPAELATLETREFAVDRSHNDTLDHLATLGVMGLMSFYLLMGVALGYALYQLRFLDSRESRFALMMCLLGGVGLGFLAPVAVQGRLTYAGFGMAMGLLAGAWVFMAPRVLGYGGLSAPETPRVRRCSLAILGLVGALIAHFIETQFVLSIVATHLYFWLCLGLLIVAAHTLRESGDSSIAVSANGEGPRRSAAPLASAGGLKKKRGHPVPGLSAKMDMPEAGDCIRDDPASVMGWMLAMILMCMIFGFVVPPFLWGSAHYAFVWLPAVLWLSGLMLGVGSMPWRGSVAGTWGKPVAVYTGITVVGVGLYGLAHYSCLNTPPMIRSLADAVASAALRCTVCHVFFGAVVVGVLGYALCASLSVRTRSLPWMKARWAWLYLLLLGAGCGLIVLKNVRPMDADVYYGDSQKYREQSLYDAAALVQSQALVNDPSEDFYALMASLIQQLKAQDPRTPPGVTRKTAWTQAERYALAAQTMNPFAPISSGGLGILYLTWGGRDDVSKLPAAVRYFNQALCLAPQNVQYQYLLAKAHVALGRSVEALFCLKQALQLDPGYAPLWGLMGDIWGIQGHAPAALGAHVRTIQSDLKVFADDQLHARLVYHQSKGQLAGLLDALKSNAASYSPPGLKPYVLGHGYVLMKDYARALVELETARTCGMETLEMLMLMAEAYALVGRYEQAETLYRDVLARQADNVRAISGLGFVADRRGSPEEAIRYNRQVLQQKPGDYTALKNLAILYDKTQKPDQALAAAAQAYAVAPECEKASLNRLIQDVKRKQKSP